LCSQTLRPSGRRSRRAAESPARTHLKPLGLSQNKLARDLDVPVSRIAGILKESRAITADTALRLIAYFGTSPELWPNLQTDIDLRKARRPTRPEIEERIRPCDAA